MKIKPKGLLDVKPYSLVPLLINHRFEKNILLRVRKD
jgi:hypothetical protein